MPFISVCVPTNRVGGLDVLLAGLARQTFKDFEVVLSDALYRRRPGLAAEVGASLGICVKHVEPRNNLFPLNQFSHVANEALAHATGEIVLFLVDYTHLPPNVLETHAQFHAAGDRRRGLMLPHAYFALPKLSADFHRYETSETARYVDDVVSGRLDRLMLSIFETPILPGHVFADRDTNYSGVDVKTTLPESDSVDPCLLHGKNESCALSAVLDVNGWDESLDGGHCYQDSDLAERLTYKAGIRWSLRNAPVAQIINPRQFFPFPVRPRSPDGNRTVWQSKKAAGYPPVNTWKLR